MCCAVTPLIRLDCAPLGSWLLAPLSTRFSTRLWTQAFTPFHNLHNAVRYMPQTLEQKKSSLKSLICGKCDNYRIFSAISG